MVVRWKKANFMAIKSIPDKVLYVIATILDHNRICYSLSIGLSVPGDPRRTKYRRWAEKMIKNKKQRQKIYNALLRLQKRKLIEKKVFKDNAKGYVITPIGRLLLFGKTASDIKRKKLPQNQYILVLFDIPEKMHALRDIFRANLKLLNFEKVQQSVWICRYDVLGPVKKLINDSNLSAYVKLLKIVDAD